MRCASRPRRPLGTGPAGTRGLARRRGSTRPRPAQRLVARARRQRPTTTSAQAAHSRRRPAGATARSAGVADRAAATTVDPRPPGRRRGPRPDRRQDGRPGDPARRARRRGERPRARPRADLRPDRDRRRARRPQRATPASRRASAAPRLIALDQMPGGKLDAGGRTAELDAHGRRRCARPRGGSPAGTRNGATTSSAYFRDAASTRLERLTPTEQDTLVELRRAVRQARAGPAGARPTRWPKTRRRGRRAAVLRGDGPVRAEGVARRRVEPRRGGVALARDVERGAATLAACCGRSAGRADASRRRLSTELSRIAQREPRRRTPPDWPTWRPRPPGSGSAEAERRAARLAPARPRPAGRRPRRRGRRARPGRRSTPTSSSRLAETLQTLPPAGARPLLAAFDQSDRRDGRPARWSRRCSDPALRPAVRAEQVKPTLAKYSARPVQAEAEKLYAAAQRRVRPSSGPSWKSCWPRRCRPGDIRRGQAVFNSAKAACIACHTIGYVGGKVGPDLTRIGGIRTERDLLESIVFPSASFVRSYEPVHGRTKDGRVFNGVLKKDAPDEIVLVAGRRQGGADRPRRTSRRCSRARCRSCRPGWTSS